MSSKYHSASHSKYLIQYHIIWCPKFRFSVLTGDIETKLKEILQNICVRYSIKALVKVSESSFTVYIIKDNAYSKAGIVVKELWKTFNRTRKDNCFKSMHKMIIFAFQLTFGELINFYLDHKSI